MAGHGLGGIEDAFFALAGFRLVDGAEDVGGGDRPVARAGDDSAVVEDGTGRILPLIDGGIDVRLENFDSVVGGFGPVELQRADYAEFAEAGEVCGLYELFVGERMRQMGVAVGFASGGDAIESSGDGPISDGVDVDDESLLVGTDAEFGELCGIEEQVAVMTGVLVRLGQMRGLRGKFGDAIGEDLDSGYVQVGDVLVLRSGFLDGG